MKLKIGKAKINNLVSNRLSRTFFAGLHNKNIPVCEDDFGKNAVFAPLAKFL